MKEDIASLYLQSVEKGYKFIETGDPLRPFLLWKANEDYTAFVDYLGLNKILKTERHIDN